MLIAVIVSSVTKTALHYCSPSLDKLKYDWCNTDGLNAQGVYLTMRDALYDAGRPIVFSICEWVSSKLWTWTKNVGHLWRNTGDITEAGSPGVLCKFWTSRRDCVYMPDRTTGTTPT
jgi:alpha-galactosidase